MVFNLLSLFKLLTKRSFEEMTSHLFSLLSIVNRVCCFHNIMQIKEKALSTEELAKFSYKEFKKLNWQLIETEAGSCKSSNLSVLIEHSKHCDCIWKTKWTFRESGSKTFKSFETTWRRLLQRFSQSHGSGSKRARLPQRENRRIRAKRQKRLWSHHLVQRGKTVDVRTALPPTLWLQRPGSTGEEICWRYQRTPWEWSENNLKKNKDLESGSLERRNEKRQWLHRNTRPFSFSPSILFFRPLALRATRIATIRLRIWFTSKGDWKRNFRT